MNNKTSQGYISSDGSADYNVAIVILSSIITHFSTFHWWLTHACNAAGVAAQPTAQPTPPASPQPSELCEI